MMHSLSQLILKTLGWKVIDNIPASTKKGVVAVVPHTSAWDFPLGLLVRSSIKKDIKYVGKSSLFKSPMGWFFRMTGGYPVDRSKNNNFVDAVVQIFNKEEAFMLCLAPEGTRRRVERLKTGFYYIALNAGVPIFLTKFDYTNREVTFAEPFYPTGNKEKDFEFIHQYFDGVLGKRPEKSFFPISDPKA